MTERERIEAEIERCWQGEVGVDTGIEGWLLGWADWSVELALFAAEEAERPR